MQGFPEGRLPPRPRPKFLPPELRNVPFGDLTAESGTPTPTKLRPDSLHGIKRPAWFDWLILASIVMTPIVTAIAVRLAAPGCT